MTIGGIIAILIAIWIYRTASEEKTGNTFYWVAGSFVVYLFVQFLMIQVNLMIVETFDTDLGEVYDAAGGLNSRDNSDSGGLQSGTGGTFIGILFELFPWIVPFFVVAVVRQLVMLKQAFDFMGMFSGIKEMFIAIKNSFKTSES